MTARTVAFALAAIAPPACLQARPIGPSDFRIVAKTGDPAPGLLGDPFYNFTSATINQQGRTLFTASNFVANQALWIETIPVAGSGPGPIARVIGRGDPAPGFPGMTVGTAGGHHNNSNLVVIRGTLSGPGAIPGLNDSCLWLGPIGNLQVVTRAGAAWPTPGRTGTFASLPTPALNDAGQIVFYDASNVIGNRGLWRAAYVAGLPVATTISPLALEGAPAPGISNAVFIGGFRVGVSSPVPNLSALGVTAFASDTSGPGSTLGRGVWLGPLHAPGLLLRNDQPIPGLPASLSAGAIAETNNNGQIMLFDYLGTPEAGTILVGTPSNLSVIAQEGSAVTTLTQPHPQLSAIGAVIFSNAGRVVFSSRLSGAGVNLLNDRAILANTTGDVRVVARAGDPAPGTPWRYGDLFSIPHVNARGDVAFESTLRNADGSNPGVGYGVWHADRNGIVQPVAVPGGIIDIDPGNGITLRAIAQARIGGFGSGGNDGSPSALNDRGELAVVISYEADPNNLALGAGNGVFVVTLPNPCAADFDGDGVRSIDDIFVFLNAWFAGCTGQLGSVCNGLNADVDGVNGRTIDDIFIFLNLWFAGC